MVDGLPNHEMCGAWRSALRRCDRQDKAFRGQEVDVLGDPTSNEGHRY